MTYGPAPGSPITVGPSPYPAGEAYSRYYNPVTISLASNQVWTTDQLLGGELRRNCNGGARNDTTPTAAQFIAAFGLVPNGAGVEFQVRNTSPTAVTLTITAGANVTTVGTAALSLAQNELGFFAVRALTPTTVELVSQTKGAG